MSCDGRSPGAPRILVVSPALQGFFAADDLASGLFRTAAELKVPVYCHTGGHSLGGPTQIVLLAAQCPQTQFILGHCGSTDYAYDMPVVLEANLKNLWFEVSLARPWAAAAYARLPGGRSRLIFGSSAPRNDPLFELEQVARQLPIEDYPDVYGSNLIQLLGEAA